MKRWHAAGLSAAAIVRETGIGRKSVLTWIRLRELPERHRMAPRPGMPEFYREYLWQRWTEGCQSVKRLMAEVQPLGYIGGYAGLAKLVAQKTTLDHLVEMHREFLTGMSRRARHAVEARHRQLRQDVTKALATVLHAINILLDQQISRETRLEKFYQEHDEEALREAVATCREFHALGDDGHFDELLARHSHLKRYLPGFLKLPFCGEPGMEPLLVAIAFGRRLHSETPPPRSEATPTQFAAGAWRAVLTRRPTDHRLWEIALAFAMRDALRAGDLYLAESRHHVSFWNLVHHPAEWEEKRGAAYRELNLPTEAERAIDRLRADLEQAARDLARGLDANPFASLRDGRLEYTRLHSTEESGRVGELRRVIETHLPRVRIEDLLLDVDSWCGFTRALTPIAGVRAHAETPDTTLLAALVAHGTKLGIATMSQSTDGMSVDALHHCRAGFSGRTRSGPPTPWW